MEKENEISDIEDNCCSQCGQKNEADIRYLACIAKTKYCNREGVCYFNNDNVEFWKIQLCKKCQPRSRMIFIKGRIKSGLKSFGSGLALVCIGLLCLLFTPLSDMLETSGSLVENAVSGASDWMDWLLLFASFIALATGIPMFLWGIFSVPKHLLLKKKFQSDLTVSNKWINRCVVGEGERILSLLASGTKQTQTYKQVFGEYILPKFKNASELSPKEKEEAAKSHNMVQWRKREIIQRAIGNTIDEVTRKLPKEKKPLVSSSPPKTFK